MFRGALPACDDSLALGQSQLVVVVWLSTGPANVNLCFALIFVKLHSFCCFLWPYFYFNCMLHCFTFVGFVLLCSYMYVYTGDYVSIDYVVLI